MALTNVEISEPFKVNCDVYWAYLTQIDEKTGKYEYKLCNLSGPAVAKLSGLGVNILQRNKMPEMGDHCRSWSQYTIPFVGPDGEAYPAGTIVGNGSKAQATVRVKSGDNSYGRQHFVETLKLQILELAEYDGEGPVNMDGLEVL